MFDFSHTENEQRLRREESLEKRYWEYLEFYMNALSKALQYWKESTWKNAFMVFHRVNIQQMYVFLSAYIQFCDSRSSRNARFVLSGSCTTIVQR